MTLGISNADYLAQQRAFGGRELNAKAQAILNARAAQSALKMEESRKAAQVALAAKGEAAKAALQPDVRAYLERKGFVPVETKGGINWAKAKTLGSGLKIQTGSPESVGHVTGHITENLAEGAIRNLGWRPTNATFETGGEGRGPSWTKTPVKTDVYWVQKDAAGNILKYSKGQPDISSEVAAELRRQSIEKYAQKEAAAKAAAEANTMQVPMTFVGVQSANGEYKPTSTGMQWVQLPIAVVQQLTSPQQVQVGLSGFETLGHLGDDLLDKDVTVKALEDKTLPAPKPATKSWLAGILPAVGVGVALWLIFRKRR